MTLLTFEGLFSRMNHFVSNHMTLPLEGVVAILASVRPFTIVHLVYVFLQVLPADAFLVAFFACECAYT